MKVSGSAVIAAAGGGGDGGLADKTLLPRSTVRKMLRTLDLNCFLSSKLVWNSTSSLPDSRIKYVSIADFAQNAVYHHHHATATAANTPQTINRRRPFFSFL